MNKIEAYKCEFCGKIYANPKTIKAHEKKCYFNPSTRSCAACENHKLVEKRIDLGSYTLCQVCKANVDIQGEGLQFGCSLYVERENRDEEEILNLIPNGSNMDFQWDTFLNSSFKALSRKKLL